MTVRRNGRVRVLHYGYRPRLTWAGRAVGPMGHWPTAPCTCPVVQKMTNNGFSWKPEWDGLGAIEIQRWVGWWVGGAWEWIDLRRDVSAGQQAAQCRCAPSG